MELAYRTIGNGAKNLVIAHGVFGSGDNWMTVSKLIDADYTCYLLDMRNHGKSGNSDTHTYADMVGDIAEFIKKHRIEGCVLMGHSMGGKAAMFFALEHEDLISKLIIVDIAPRYYGVHHDRHITGMQAIDLNKLESRAEADSILAQYVPETDTRQFLLKNLARTDTGFAWRINLPVLTKEISNIGEAIPDYARVKMPTLFVRGELSYYIRQEDEAKIHELFLNSHIITVANAGHWVQAEAPVAFAEVINNFLNA